MTCSHCPFTAMVTRLDVPKFSCGVVPVKKAMSEHRGFLGLAPVRSVLALQKRRCPARS